MLYSTLCLRRFSLISLKLSHPQTVVSRAHQILISFWFLIAFLTPILEAATLQERMGWFVIFFISKAKQFLPPHTHTILLVCSDRLKIGIAVTFSHSSVTSSPFSRSVYKKKKKKAFSEFHKALSHNPHLLAVQLLLDNR